MMGLGFFDNSKGSKAMEEAHKKLLRDEEIKKAEEDRKRKERENKK